MRNRASGWSVPVLLLSLGLVGPAEVLAQEPEGWVFFREDSVSLVLMGRCWEREGRKVCVDTRYMFLDPDP